MQRENYSVFNIESISDYITFCKHAVGEFEKEQASVLYGFTAILSLNHIPDWLQYKLTLSQRKALGLSGTLNTPVKEHYENIIPDLKLVRSIANGFKHLKPTIFSTDLIEGYGQGPYGVGPFGSPYLLIDHGVESNERPVDGFSLCKSTLNAWNEVLQPIL